MEHTLQQVRSYVEEQKTWPARGPNTHADALAQSWHRLLSQACMLDQTLKDSYSDLLTAWCAKERWEAAHRVGFDQFFRGKQLQEVVAECALLRIERFRILFVLFFTCSNCFTRFSKQDIGMFFFVFFVLCVRTKAGLG